MAEFEPLFTLALLPQLRALARTQAPSSPPASALICDCLLSTVETPPTTMAPGTVHSFPTLRLCDSANSLAATQFEAAQPPTDAVSALVFAPGASKRLLVSSWDKNVYLYEVVDGAEEANLVGTFEHRAPVLDVCFGASPDEAYTAGMDHQVKRSVSSSAGRQNTGG